MTTATQVNEEDRGRALKWTFGGLATLAAGYAIRDHLLDASLFALTNLWQMAPIIITGLIITAALTATGATTLLARTFDKREVMAIITVSLIGSVLPVCGITVLPLVIGLLSAGIPLAPVMAFLLSSAVTDPQMLAITAATLGWAFAIGKTLAAIGIGVSGGTVVLMIVRRGGFSNPTRQSSLLNKLMPQSCGSAVTGIEWQFWRHSERLNEFTASSWRLMKLVTFWLSLAFIAEYFLKLYLPEDFFAAYVGQDNAYAIPIAAIIGAPLYLDGYAALPFVRGLIDRGMAESAAMAFLIAGGIVSAWTAIPVFALFRLPVFLTYVTLAITGSMFAGWAYAIAVPN